MMIPRSLQSWHPEPGFPLKCGLEIHTQLMTSHKLFSLAPNNATSPPNRNTSFFDVALPGTFPKLNPQALLLALKAATVLKSNVNPSSSFDRKHYFYLDQPHGYQITQHFQPLALGGYLNLTQKFDGIPNKKIRIEQIQLEQDTAKLNYDDYDGSVTVDFNRANVPLIELVTKPDFDHLAQVRAFIKKYIGIMTHLGVCSGDMENGAMRCDVNVSVAGGNRVEIKNLGSTTEIAAALIYEYKRQVKLLKGSNAIINQETRSWDGKQTIRTRSKEDAQDYRYYPDIELPRISVSPLITEQIAQILPKLPEELFCDLIEPPFSLEKKHARFLLDNPPFLSYYKELHTLVVPKHTQSSQTLNNWFFHRFLGAFTKLDRPVDLSLVSSHQLASLISMVESRELSITSARYILSALVLPRDDVKGRSISELVEQFDLGAPTGISDQEFDDAVRGICLEIMNNHPDVVEKIKGGKPKSIKYLVGQAMRETQGRVDSKQFEAKFKDIIFNVN